MKDKDIIKLKKQLENWINFNKKRDLHLLDVSEVITILKQFYIIEEIKK